MKIFNTASLGRAAVLLAVAILATPTLLGQPASRPLLQQNAISSAAPQEDLRQQVLSDPAGYAAAIALRWEADARALGKWDPNYSVDLQKALTALPPDSLLAAGQASSYHAMMAVLATSRPLPTSGPLVLGDITGDLTFTPVAPCRIVDTRNIGGAFSGFRDWDMDGSNFSSQGGHAGSCGIPNGVAQAVVMNITLVSASTSGYLTAWRFGSAQPLASTINWFTGGEIVANGAIIPTWPGAGADFSVFTFNATDVIIDVTGYFEPATMPIVGRAYAVVETDATFLPARTKGFSAVSRIGTGIYCLTTSVNLTNSVQIVTVEWGNSSGNKLSAYINYLNNNCAAGLLEVRTYNTDTGTASNSVAFNVFIP
jgi:hypothetical protein